MSLLSVESQYVMVSWEEGIQTVAVVGDGKGSLEVHKLYAYSAAIVIVLQALSASGLYTILSTCTSRYNVDHVLQLYSQRLAQEVLYKAPACG